MLYQLSYSRMDEMLRGVLIIAPENVVAISLGSELRNGGESRIRTYEGVSQQIYSLPPLAAWVSPLIPTTRSQWTDSNPRPADYKSAALPAELHWPVQLKKERLLTHFWTQGPELGLQM